MEKSVAKKPEDLTRAAIDLMQPPDLLVNGKLPTKGQAQKLGISRMATYKVPKLARS